MTRKDPCWPAVVGGPWGETAGGSCDAPVWESARHARGSAVPSAVLVAVAGQTAAGPLSEVGARSVTLAR
jgi:hypothetical protein